MVRHSDLGKFIGQDRMIPLFFASHFERNVALANPKTTDNVVCYN